MNRTRADGAPKLFVDVLGEVFSFARLDEPLVTLDQLFQIVGGELRVLRLVQFVFETVHQRVERVVRLLCRGRYTHHHTAVHLDEAAVAVVCEAGIRRALCEPLYSLVIQTEVQNRIHHARHRFACAGAHRQQQRVVAIAECLVLLRFDFFDRRFDVGGQPCGVTSLVVVEVGADVGADRESRRYRQTDRRHLSQIGAFAAEQVAHRAATVGLLAERVDVLGALLDFDGAAAVAVFFVFLTGMLTRLLCCDSRIGGRSRRFACAAPSPFLPAWE
jgi:hypothetical protein